MKKSKKRKEERRRDQLLYLEFKAREFYYETQGAMRREKDRAIELLQRAINAKMGTVLFSELNV